MVDQADTDEVGVLSSRISRRKVIIGTGVAGGCLGHTGDRQLRQPGGSTIGPSVCWPDLRLF